MLFVTILLTHCAFAVVKVPDILSIPDYFWFSNFRTFVNVNPHDFDRFEGISNPPCLWIFLCLVTVHSYSLNI